MVAPLRSLVNERSASSPITDEVHVVGEDTANEIYLDERPEPGTAITVTDPSGPTNLSQIISGSPIAGEFKVEYETGRLIFHSDDNDLEVEVDYSAVGSVLLERDVNRIHDRFSGDAAATGRLYTEEVVITAAANVALNLKTQQVAFMEVDQDVVLDNPTEQVAGTTGILFIQMDGVGGWVVSFDTDWVAIGAGTINDNPDARSVVSWAVRGTEVWYSVSSE